jgi:hypothetical protein
MKSRAATCVLVTIALLVPARAPSPQAAGGAAVEKNLSVTLKISDSASGLTLEAKKAVVRDTSAFDAVRHVIAMTYRTDPEIGPVVTSLCGVAAPKGSAWSCSIDGQVWRNLGSVGLKADVTIEWKTVPVK